MPATDTGPHGPFLPRQMVPATPYEIAYNLQKAREIEKSIEAAVKASNARFEPSILQRALNQAIAIKDAAFGPISDAGEAVADAAGSLAETAGQLAEVPGNITDSVREFTSDALDTIGSGAFKVGAGVGTVLVLALVATAIVFRK